MSNIVGLMTVPLLLVVLFSSLKVFTSRFTNIEILTVWLLSEFIHVYLSNARFDHYKNLLIFPTFLLLVVLATKIDRINFIIY